MYPPLIEKRGITINSSTLWGLKIVSFLMAFDLMVVFLTVRSYWVSEGGSNATYGLVFSSYSIAQFVAIPIVSAWMENHSMKGVLVVTVALNVIGNIVYGLGATVSGDGGKALIVLGRITAGVGAANIITGPYYIVKNIPDVTTRSLYINGYNLAAFFGRVLGPMVAFGIFEIKSSTIAGIVFDHNTDPPFITALFGVVVLVFIIVTKYDAPSEAVPQTDHHYSLARVLFPDLVVLLVISAATLFVYWGWYVNLVTFAAIQFGYAQEYGNRMYFNAYIPALVGSIVGMYSYKIAVKKGVTPFQLLMASPILMAIGLVIGFDYGTPDKWRLWATGIFIVSGSNWCGTSLTPIYSHIVESTGYSGAMARLIGLLTLAQSVGRGLGPIWPPLLLFVTGPTDCCTYNQGDTSNCSCCGLKGANALIGILLAGCALLFVAVMVPARSVVNKHSSHPTANINN